MYLYVGIDSLFLDRKLLYLMASARTSALHSIQCAAPYRKLGYFIAHAPHPSWTNS